MPIYEYECQSCGEKFELRRSINDSDQEVTCPRCGNSNARRVLSAFSAGHSGSSFGSCLPSSPT